MSIFLACGVQKARRVVMMVRNLRAGCCQPALAAESCLNEGNIDKIQSLWQFTKTCVSNDIGYAYGVCGG
jgi:hypothetical protein